MVQIKVSQSSYAVCTNSSHKCSII